MKYCVHDFWKHILEKPLVIVKTLTWWIVRSLKSCWRFLSKTSPTMTSLGTISRSRKNSDKTLAMSVKELWKWEKKNMWYRSRICATYIYNNTADTINKIWNVCHGSCKLEFPYDKWSCQRLVRSSKKQPNKYTWNNVIKSYTKEEAFCQDHLIQAGNSFSYPYSWNSYWRKKFIFSSKSEIFFIYKQNNIAKKKSNILIYK